MSIVQDHRDYLHVDLNYVRTANTSLTKLHCSEVAEYNLQIVRRDVGDTDKLRSYRTDALLAINNPVIFASRGINDSNDYFTSSSL